ncbi:serine hydrolase domain-containing protein [Sandarakinorhabdus sp. DWP1-3-1]|uniref:serine hydrolase domain-containing protein n=1 Tax=Sandarakinorhabdus sp. DWP1-3-1 TaxID=2804627 RepID=UPI003CFB1A6C
MTATSAVFAQHPVADTHGPAAIAAAVATDPVTLGWMQGTLPPDDKLVRLSDGSAWRFPQLRWSFSNFQQLVPTLAVARGDGRGLPFPIALRGDIDTLQFTPLAGSGFDGPVSWADAMLANFTDAIMVVHRDTVVYERYWGVTGPTTRHLLASVSKSFVGTIAAMLIADGSLDEAATVGTLVPELAASGFGDATLRQVLDMTTALAYSEDYTSPTADIARLASASGLGAGGVAGDEGGVCAYLPTIAKAGEHGAAFTYRTCNTDVLAWILRRTTGKPLAALVSELFWQPLGMDRDALYTVDSRGTEFAGGGLNATLRDIARFGELMRRGGSLDGKRLVAPDIIDDIRRGGDPERFAPAGYATLPGWSYRNQWWVSHDAHCCFTARGVRGQMIWVDPVAEMTIARLGSHPLAGNGNFDATSLPAWTAVAELLMR